MTSYIAQKENKLLYHTEDLYTIKTDVGLSITQISTTHSGTEEFIRTMHVLVFQRPCPDHDARIPWIP